MIPFTEQGREQTKPICVKLSNRQQKKKQQQQQQPSNLNHCLQHN